LLLTGYWPVTGESVAIAARGGPVALLVPEDERELAEKGFADVVHTFVPETLDRIATVSDAIKPHMAAMLRSFKIKLGSIGIESGASFQAASYLALHLYGGALADILRELVPGARLVSADQHLQTLKSIKTPYELAKIRQACAIAQAAYSAAAPQLHAGMSEPTAAELFRADLNRPAPFANSTLRCDGFAFCMSGPNSAKASAAYARTRSRVLEDEDLVMMHCNSYVDGFWTDITRTYTLGVPDEKKKKMYEAVHEARDAALAIIKPGIPAAEVDLMARGVVEKFGLGSLLRHGTGHGVGYSPMSAYSRPRIHAASPDILDEGMVFNIEPAVYVEGHGGVRQCNMAAVCESGVELLTPFQMDLATVILASGSRGAEGGALEGKAAH
jgi:Xaa-Pro aminopeptidase